MKIGLEPVHPNGPRKQMNATNASFTRTNNIQLLAGANRDVMQAMGFLIAVFFGWETSHIFCKNNSVRNIVN